MTLYDAFVSYSHAEDKPIAAALQSVIQKLGKPWYHRRALRLFRDDTSLAATPHLWPTIVQALGQSRFFILLASPEAAASKWVDREVSHWLEHGGIDTLLIGVTAGDLQWDETSRDFASDDANPLPRVLAGKFPAEPKWVDLRAYREGANPRDSRFIEAGANFAAAIRGMPKEDLLSQEVRQQRRALTLAWSAAGLLLVLAIAAIGAGILAYRAQQDAVAQRTRAEQTLAAATQTANGLVFDLAVQFRDALGVPASLIKDILDRARALQDQLTASGQTTPKLQQSQAVALDETAGTLLTIGDTAAAFAAADRSRQILEALLVSKPDDADLLDDLSSSYKRVGDVLVKQGKLDDALKAYRDNLAIRERLAATDPSNTEWQRLLSVPYNQIGQVLVKQGKLDEALKTYREGLAVIERVAAANPSNTQWQRDLSVSYSYIGDVLLPQGKLDEALKTYRDSVAILERLAATDRSNTLWQSELSVEYQRVGEVLVAQGKLDDALKAFQDNLAITGRLATADPGNTKWQRGLSTSDNKIGDVLIAQRKPDDALKAYGDALAIIERLVATDPSNTLWQRDLSYSYREIGYVQTLQGKLDDAFKAFSASLTIRERLAATDPSNAEWQYDLFSSHENIGSVLALQGKLDDALKGFRDALAIAERLAAAEPSNTRLQQDLRIVIGKIGGIAYNFLLAHDFAQALAAADQAISLTPDQIWLYTNRAHALMFLGRVDAARALYLKYQGQKLPEQDGKSWQTAVLEDFADLRKVGLTNPLMDEVEKLFKSAR
jgi:tetratricopeptide (TPR) repeat protein